MTNQALNLSSAQTRHIPLQGDIAEAYPKESSSKEANAVQRELPKVAEAINPDNANSESVSSGRSVQPLSGDWGKKEVAKGLAALALIVAIVVLPEFVIIPVMVKLFISYLGGVGALGYALHRYLSTTDQQFDELNRKHPSSRRSKPNNRVSQQNDGGELATGPKKTQHLPTPEQVTPQAKIKDPREKKLKPQGRPTGSVFEEARIAIAASRRQNIAAALAQARVAYRSAVIAHGEQVGLKWSYEALITCDWAKDMRKEMVEPLEEQQKALEPQKVAQQQVAEPVLLQIPAPQGWASFSERESYFDEIMGQFSAKDLNLYDSNGEVAEDIIKDDTLWTLPVNQEKIRKAYFEELLEVRRVKEKYPK